MGCMCVFCVLAPSAGGEIAGGICHSRHSSQSRWRKSSTGISSPWSTEGNNLSFECCPFSSRATVQFAIAVLILCLITAQDTSWSLSNVCGMMFLLLFDVLQLWDYQFVISQLWDYQFVISQLWDYKLINKDEIEIVQYSIDCSYQVATETVTVNGECMEGSMVSFCTAVCTLQNTFN